MRDKRHNVFSRFRAVAEFRWRLVFVWGLVAGVAPYAFSILLINLYATTDFLTFNSLGRVFGFLTGGGEVESFATLLARSGTPAFYLISTVSAAMYVGRRVGRLATLHGFVIGAVAYLTSCAMTVPFFGWPEPYEYLVYPFVTVGGGLLGGMKGWEIRLGEDSLGRASRAVRVARSPGGICDAIGENLTGSTIVEVGIWGLENRGEGIEPLGNWCAGESRPLHPGMGFGSVETLASTYEPVRLRAGRLSGADRSAWKGRGVGSALLLPLVSASGDVPALLLVASEKRRGFSRRDIRAYANIASMAALALENMELVNAARKSGKRAGTLEERQRLAAEIHDTLAQGFTSIVTNLQAAEGRLYSGGAVEYIVRAREIARESLAEARRLVWALRPGRLEDAPLPDAVRDLTEDWAASSGVRVEVSVVGDALPTSAQTEATIFRAAQEALNNVGKHAGAGRVAVTLSYMPESVVLDVRDDGVGFEVSELDGMPSVNGSGFGLIGMRDRARISGGVLSVESQPGEGTTISLEMPVSTAVGAVSATARRNA